jgi:hypothetical protein
MTGTRTERRRCTSQYGEWMVPGSESPLWHVMIVSTNMYAFRYDRLNCVEVLVEDLAAEVNLTDKQGNTPAHVAAQHGRSDALSV